MLEPVLGARSLPALIASLAGRADAEDAEDTEIGWVEEIAGGTMDTTVGGLKSGGDA
jgi:hypothetical protein